MVACTVLGVAVLLLQHGQSAAQACSEATQGSILMQRKTQEAQSGRLSESSEPSGTSQHQHQHKHHRHHQPTHQSTNVSENTTAESPSEEPEAVAEPEPETLVFGKEKCPCVGLDNITGVTTVLVLGHIKVEYPADLGAHCAAWDDRRHPTSCKNGVNQEPGAGNGWCAQQWCFVDPCNCNIDATPKTSSYLPDGNYQGKPIYYSYATCGGKDTWNEDQATQMTEAEESLCSEHKHESSFGKDECKCIGINGKPGTTNVTISGKQVPYPADSGTMCKAWDLENHPECSGSGNASTIPDWCAKKWCYVDPCSCPLAVPPKTSSYLPDANFEGHAVYFSYDTCGDEDTWTSENSKHACVNQKSEHHCVALDKCSWDAKKEACLGKDLLEACPAPETEPETLEKVAAQHSAFFTFVVVMLALQTAVAVLAVVVARNFR